VPKERGGSPHLASDIDPPPSLNLPACRPISYVLPISYISCAPLPCPVLSRPRICPVSSLLLQIPIDTETGDWVAWLFSAMSCEEWGKSGRIIPRKGDCTAGNETIMLIRPRHGGRLLCPLLSLILCIHTYIHTYTPILPMHLTSHIVIMVIMSVLITTCQI
jgi:hypothetical protein